jgi:hypothetical protein
LDPPEPPEPSVEDAGASGVWVGVAAQAAGADTGATINHTTLAAITRAGHRASILDTARPTATRRDRATVTVIINHSEAGRTEARERERRRHFGGAIAEGCSTRIALDTSLLPGHGRDPGQLALPGTVTVASHNGNPRQRQLWPRQGQHPIREPGQA